MKKHFQNLKRLAFWSLAAVAWLAILTQKAAAQGNIDCSGGTAQINYTGQVFFNYGSASSMVSGSNRSAITVGEMAIQQNLWSQTYNGGLGFWTRFLMPPQAPAVFPSEGDLPDRINVEWVMDPLSPSATVGFNIYRNGTFLANVEPTVRTFVDFNVIAGEFYTYQIAGINQFGEGQKGSALGFLNPNGVVTGQVKTVSGNAVEGCTVALTPTIGTALAFSGDDDCFVEQENSMFAVGPFTVEAWVKLEGTNDATGIIDRGSDVNKNWWLHTSATVSGKGVRFGLGSGDPTTVQALFPPATADAWHHVAATFNGQSLLLYLDGELKTSVPATMDTLTRPLFFGKKTQTTGHFTGKLDEVRVFERQLSQTEIQQTMMQTISSTTDGLAAYWKMDEGVGQKAFDLGPQKRKAYLCGATFSADRPTVQSAAMTDEKGFYKIEGINYGSGTTFTARASKNFYKNQSLEFNAVNEQWAELTNFDLPDSATIGLGFKPFDFSPQQVLLSKQDGSTDQFLVWLDSDLLKVTMGAETHDFGQIDAGFQMHHFVIRNTGAGTEVKFYKNDAFVGTHLFSGATSDWATGTPWRLGKKNGTGGAQLFFTGLIDEVVFYRKLLDLPSIQVISNIGTDGGDARILSNFPLNEGQDSLLTDLGEAMTGDGKTKGALWATTARINETSPHLFQPGIKLVTLNPSNTSTDGVDFIDQSTVPVSGFVRFDGTTCFAEGAEILINGNHALPPVYTDADGKFIVDLEPGQSAQLSPVLKNHTFFPAFWEVRKVASPIAGILFRDMTKREVRGQLAGNDRCRKSIIPDGAVVKVKVATENGCFEKIDLLENADGRYVITGIPPFEATVAVIEHSVSPVYDYFQLQGGVGLDLSEKGDTVDFIYYSAPEVEMTALDTNQCGDAMLLQSEKYATTIRVFQDYFGDKCFLDTAALTITNAIADMADPIDTMMTEGKLVHKFRAGQPNIVSPFLKTLSVEAEANAFSSTSNQQAVVLGKRPRSVNFASTSPQIPFLILHDPTGDGSSSRLEKGESSCFGFEVGASISGSVNQSLSTKLGTEIEFAVGLGFEETTEITIEDTQTFGVEMTASSTFTNSNEVCVTASEVISTSDGDILVGDDADLYMGGAMNLLFGVTDDLIFDTLACSFLIDTGIIIFPDKFQTTFIYTDYHIRTVVIPDLLATGNAASAAQWQKILDLNAANKAAAAFRKNISFASGVVYDESTTESSSSSNSISFEVGVTATIANEFGFEIDGSGVTSSLEVQIGFGLTGSTTSSNSREKTIGYTLADDDPGDYFTVNVKKDKVYGTPVFQTVSGASSCPFEEKTVPRDFVELSVDKFSEVNVPEKGAATFEFTLGNISETEDTREYLFSLIPESNTSGAVVKIQGGSPLDRPFGLPFGEGQKVTVTIERGSDTAPFEYDDLEFAIFSECEDSRGVALGLASIDPKFYKSVLVDVSFLEDCSRVDIGNPLPNWVQTPADGPIRFVTADEYDIMDADLELLRLQYRRTQGDGAWINVAEVLKADLGPLFEIFEWDTDGLADGLYEIRVIAQCVGGLESGISHVIAGKIERTPPEIFGVPEPADGVWGRGDEISVTFTEPIRCDLLIQADFFENNNVGLYDAQTGDLIDFTMTCSGDKIFVVPNVPKRFLENRLLRVEVDSIQDLAGNKFGHFEWEFTADQNALNWLDRTAVKVAKYEEDFVKVERRLENRGGYITAFELKNTPDWCKIYPKSGELAPGEVLVINFEFDQTMVFGQKIDTIIASGAEGDEPMIVDGRVVCREPLYEIDPGAWVNSMNLSVELDVEGTVSTDDQDILSAWVDGELRGFSKVEYVESIDKHLVFLTVYSNAITGETVDFKVWDASDCRLFSETQETFPFESDELIGTPQFPQVIHTNSIVLKEIPISGGWNWLSFNLELAEPSPDSLLVEIGDKTNTIIRNQTQFSEFFPGFGYFGSLAAVNELSSYRFRANAPDTIVMLGAPLDPDSVSIPLAVGWNWIGFIPQQALTVDEALAGITVLSGDLVKSQTEFAQFVAGFGWIGNLQYLVPGQGYVIKTSILDTLVYPDLSGLMPHTPAAVRDRGPQTSHFSVVPSQFEHSMTLIGFVRKNGQNIVQPEWELGAFVGAQCRGAAKPVWVAPLGGWLFFQTIYANTSGETVAFRGWDGAAEMPFSEKEIFAIDAQKGSISAPFVFEIGATATKNLADEKAFLTVDPNPLAADQSARIRFSTGIGERVSAQIFDATGRLIFSRPLDSKAASNELLLAPETLPTGFFTIKITGRERSLTEKLIVR